MSLIDDARKLAQKYKAGTAVMTTIPKPLENAYSKAAQVFLGTPTTTPSTIRTTSIPGVGSFKTDISTGRPATTSRTGLSTQEKSQIRGGSFLETKKEVDHKIPVALGGTSESENLQALKNTKTISQTVYDFLTGNKRLPADYKPKNRQEGKMLVELEAINDYKAGKLTLGQARMKVIEYQLRPETTKDFFLSSAKELAKKFTVKNFIKQTPSNVKEFFTKAIPEAAQYTARTITSIASPLKGFQPKGKVSQAILGTTEKIKGAGEETIETQNYITEKLGGGDIAKGIGLAVAPLFVGSMKGLDIVLSPLSSAKKVAPIIAKSGNLDEIIKLVKPILKGKTDDEIRAIAEPLVKITNPTEVGQYLAKNIVPKKQTFYKQVIGDNGKPVFKEVEGKPIDIVSEAKTFIHKEDKLFRVSEARTGMMIAEGKTQKEAIEKATELIERKKAELLSTIERQIEKGGESPLTKTQEVSVSPKEFKPIIDYIKQVKNYDEFKSGFRQELENNPAFKKATDAYSNTRAKYGGLKNTNLGNFVKENNIDNWQDFYDKFKTAPTSEIKPVFERAKGLSETERKIEDSAFKKIRQNEQKILSDYKAENGKTVNADKFRSYFKDEGYQGYNSAAVQEPASYLSKKAYADALNNEGKYATFTSGISGAGKSSALKDIPDYQKISDQSAVIFDSNLSSYNSAKSKIDLAIKAKKEPSIFYVYRDPLDALENGVIKRMKENPKEMGRVVPTSIMAENGPGSLKVAERLLNEGYKVRFIDNSLGKGNAIEVSLADIKAKAKYPENLKTLLDNKVKEFKNIMTPEQYRSYLGLKDFVNEELTSIQKITQILKESKPLRGKQEALYSKERSQKMAKALAMGRKTTGEAGFHAELGSLKGELSKVQFEEIRSKIGQEDIDNLFNQVKDSQLLSFWDKISARGGLSKIFEGRVPTEGELTLLNRVFPKEFIETVLGKRTLWEKFKEAGYQIANIPRSVMSSVDLSAPFRQGIFLTSHPKRFFGSFIDMFKAFGSEKSFKSIQEAIARKPTFELMKDNKLALTEMDAILTAREERFMSSWAEKIPIAGKLIRASGRAYSGFLNKLRADVFDDLIMKADKLGLAPRSNPQLTKEIANFVNVASGRGSLGGLQPAANALNSFFFSPRLMASRLTLLNPLYYIKAVPFVRKEALKSLLTLTGTVGTILALSKMAGADVSFDPRSADFGKIKIGDTRIDIMGGFQQYIRMASQLITGKYISSTTGKEITLGEGYKPLTRLDILGRQVESKEAPIFSLLTDLMRGQDYQGNPIKITEEIGNRFVPMFIGDIVDLAKDDPELLPVGLLGGFGFGVQTYVPQIKFNEPIKTEVKRLQKIGLGQVSGLAGYMAEYQSLTDKQNIELQKRAEELTNYKIEKLFQTENYKNLTDEQKAKKIEQFVDKSKILARAEKVLELTQGLQGEERKAKLTELKTSGFMTREVFNKFKQLE